MDEKRLDKLEERLDEVRSTLHSIDKTLVRQESNLQEHMRRTEIAEESIKYLRSDLRTTRAELVTEIEPIKKHVDGLNYILKVAVALSVLAGTVVSAVKVYELTQDKGRKPHAQVPEMRSQRSP